MADRIVWRVGIWAAVSSAPQAADDKISLDEQERRGREFAASIGGEVVAVYRVAHSRDIIFWADAEQEIPAYAQVRHDLEAGSVDVIHCVDSDRLGRDPALVSQFYSLAEHHGAEVYDASMPHPLGQQSMGHRYGAAIKGVAAGEDQRRRVARHRMGMRGRILKRGLHPGNWPTGYTPIRDELTGQVVGAEFDDLIGAVDLMTRLFLEGHSYTHIQERLNASPYRPRKGGQLWGYNTVREILQNDTYAGLVSWGSDQSEQSDRFPALWDNGTHQAVLRERQRRARTTYVRRGAGPLTGIAFCQRCGYQMTRRKAGDYWYLRCSGHVHRHGNEDRVCHYNNIPERVVLDALAAFLSYLSTPEVLELALSQLDGGGQQEGIERERAEAERALEGIEQKRRRLAHAFAAGDMEIGVYRQVDDDLRAEGEALAEHLAGLDRTLAAMPDLAATRAWLEELAVTFQTLLEGEAAIVSTALQTAGIRVYIEDGRVTRIGLD